MSQYRTASRHRGGRPRKKKQPFRVRRRPTYRATKKIRGRKPMPQEEHEARNVKIYSPRQDGWKGLKTDVTFIPDREKGPNPMHPIVRGEENKWDQERDNKRLNKRVLDPTNPRHQAIWMKNPDRYDMADVDTPFRDDDTITLFRGMRGKFGSDVLGDYNREEEGLGRYWTGNEQVARLYATMGTVTITDARNLAGGDYLATETIKKVREQKRERAKGEKIYIVDGKPSKSKYFYSPPEEKKPQKPYYGIIFKYDAKGREIEMYNPEGIPYEMEARQARDKYYRHDEKTLSERYPGIQVGFIKGREGRRVEWHKVSKAKEEKTLHEISKQKPTKVTYIKPVKETSKEVTYKPKYEKERTVTVYNISTESSGKVKVATKPSEHTKQALEWQKKEKEREKRRH